MTLENICKEIFKENKINKIEVMYRTNGPNKEDMLFGYCTVYKKMSGFSIESEDGDDYYMSDSIEKYIYTPEESLVVWIKSKYNNYNNKELYEDLLMEQQEQS